MTPSCRVSFLLIVVILLNWFLSATQSLHWCYCHVLCVFVLFCVVVLFMYIQWQNFCFLSWRFRILFWKCPAIWLRKCCKYLDLGPCQVSTIGYYFCEKFHHVAQSYVNPLSANPTEWSDTLKYVQS